MAKQSRDNIEMILVMCMLQASYEGPKKVYNDVCGCKTAVDDTCTFKPKKLTFTGPAACLVFAPWMR